MRTAMGESRSRRGKWTIPLAAGALLAAALVTPQAAEAAQPPTTTLINETFGAQTDPANFGFPTGASIGGGVLNITEGMPDYTASVSPLASSTASETTLDLRFDWKTAITNSGMKTGLELRDDAGHLIFAIAATGSELRYAVTGPDSDSTAAPDALNPDWKTTGFDRSKWYTVDLHMDFTLGKVQYTIATKETSSRVMASGTEDITGTGLAKLVACNYYGTGRQSIDNFRLTRPDYAAQGSLAGDSVYAFGDSIVYGHQYPRGFVDFTAEREGMRLTKYARNGATVGPVSSAGSGTIITQVRNASSTQPNFVVLEGGTNDAITLYETPGYTMGSVGSSKDPAALDTRTFAGSFERTIYEIQRKWPDAQLVYVPVHKLGSRDWNTQLALREIELAAAEKWGVAVADVFADTTLDTRVESQRIAYTFNGLVNGYPGTGGTGTHPNIAGITEFYVPVLTAKLAELETGEEPPDDSPIVSGAIYKIKHAATGEYLDSQGEGALIIGPATTYDDQEWIVTQQTGGAWTIENARTGRFYLDTEPDNVVIWNDGYLGTDSRWQIEATPEGFRLDNDRPDRTYLYGTTAGGVHWNTGATDDNTLWEFERQ